MAKKTTEDPQLLEEEEEYQLVYNMFITNLTITVNEGGTVIFQTGKPKDVPPGP
jgi:hypothetical protein